MPLATLGRMRTRRLAGLAATLFALPLASLGSAGCGGKATPTPPLTPRHFALSSTGVQAAPGSPQFFSMADAADLATDTDVVSVHQDFFGVPWNTFAADAPPPAQWKATMDGLASEYAGRRIFLSLQLAGGTNRTYLADLAAVGTDGAFHVTGNWSAQCYDFATATDGSSMRLAFSRYVTWMVGEFDPEWINVGAEMNMFGAQCATAWPGIVDTERAAYDAAKAAKPSVIAFPSLQNDVLLGRQMCPSGDRAACYEANFAALANLKRDRFAISTYPMGDPVWTKPSDVDADYATRAADRAGEKLVFAETGWDSAKLAGTRNGVCTTIGTYDEDEESAWLTRVLADADSHGSDLVTWWSNRDFLPASVSVSCTYDSTWQPVVDVFRALGGSDPNAQFLGEIQLKFFGTMGIRNFDGTPKGAPYRTWKAAQARPLQ